MSATEASKLISQLTVKDRSTVAGAGVDQLRDLANQFAERRVPAQVRRAAAAQGVKLTTLAQFVARCIAAGVHKPAGWTGYLKHGLAKLVGLSERTVRRCVKVLRLAGVLDGDITECHQDEQTGKYRRGPTTLRLMLPTWARSAHWRRPKPLVPAPPPSGQRRPHLAVSPGPDAYKTNGHPTDSPVDSGPWPPDKATRARVMAALAAELARHGERRPR
jgi:hypothetical protein